MQKNIIVFVTDDRQRYLAEYLPGKRRQLCYQSLQLPYFVERMKEADVIVLPTPVSKLDQTPLIREVMEEYLTDWEGIVYGGKIPENWQEMFEDKEITYYDFMKNEKVAMANAYLTAEATLSILIQKGGYQIKGQKIVITGFGKCARELARVLSSLGAVVTILARSSAARIRAKDMGYEAMDFAYGAEEICGAGAVINTVPSFVFTGSMLEAMNESTLFVDIASSPGGVSPDLKEKYPRDYHLELALPARYLQKSSGKILADMVIRQIEQEEGKDVKNPWILEVLL